MKRAREPPTTLNLGAGGAGAGAQQIIVDVAALRASLTAAEAEVVAASKYSSPYVDAAVSLRHLKKCEKERDAIAARLAAAGYALNITNPVVDALFLVAQHEHKLADAYFALGSLCKATRAEEVLWRALVLARRGQMKRTVLMQAAHKGDAARVKWLLARGAPLEVRSVATSYTSIPARTALDYATAAGHKEVIKILMTAGANADVADSSGKKPFTIAVELGHVDIVKVFIDAKVAVPDGALAIACGGGRTEIVRALIAAGAVASANESIALRYAASNGHTDIVNLLISAPGGVDVNAHDNAAIVSACARGYSAVVKSLLKAGANKDATKTIGLSVLMVAVSCGHVETVRALLDAKADVHFSDDAPLFCSINAGKIDLVRVVIAGGANVNATRLEFSALGLCAKAGRADMARELLNAGAKVAPNDPNPLNYAVESGEKCIDLIRMLIDTGGANVNAGVPEESALVRAVRRSRPADALRKLLTSGADSAIALRRASGMGNTLAVRELIAAKSDVNAADTEGKTPLAHALAGGEHADVVKLLLAAKSDPRRYPMMTVHACRCYTVDTVKLLLEAGADPNVVHPHLGTTLHAACHNTRVTGSRDYDSSRSLAVVNLLLAAGVNPRAVHSRAAVSTYLAEVINETPLHIAVTEKNSTVVQALIAAGADTCAVFTHDNKQNDTALHIVCEITENEYYNPHQSHGSDVRSRKNELAALLLAAGAGAGVNTIRSDIGSALHSLCRSNNGHSDAIIAKTLITAGADLNLVHTIPAAVGYSYKAVPSGAHTPLSLALLGCKNRSLVIELLTSGASVASATAPLHTLSRWDNKYSCSELEVAKALIAAGADVNFVHDGHAPLHAAIMNEKSYFAIELLAGGADATSLMQYQNHATSTIHLALQVYSISTQYSSGLSRMITCLIAKGAPVDTLNSLGQTPLAAVEAICKQKTTIASSSSKTYWSGKNEFEATHKLLIARVAALADAARMASEKEAQAVEAPMAVEAVSVTVAVEAPIAVEAPMAVVAAADIAVPASAFDITDAGGL